jgi:hypothetical protein
MTRRLGIIKKEGVLENKEDFLDTKFREKRERSYRYLE